MKAFYFLSADYSDYERQLFILRGEKARGILPYQSRECLISINIEFLQVAALVCAIFTFVKWQNLGSLTAAHLWATV